MRTINNMLAFRAIVEIAKSSSFREAAVLLDMDVAAVSRLVTALEKEVGNTFFDRTVRPVRLTAYGKKTLSSIRSLVTNHEALIKQLAEKESLSKRIIRFGLVSGYPRTQLLEILTDFHRLHPAIEIEVVGDVDHLDLLRGRVDAAYLLYEPDSPQLVSRFICKIGVLPVASRAYIEKYGQPNTPEDLIKHTLLQRVSRNYPKSDYLINGLSRHPIHAAHLLSGDYLTVKSALFASLGIAIDLPTYSIREGLQTGEIVPVLGKWQREPFHVSIVTRRTDQSDPTTDAFVTWFVKCERRAALERFQAVGLPFENKHRFLSWR